MVGCLWLLVALLAGCKRPPKVPGETDIAVTSVTLQEANGGELSLDDAALIPRLGMRAATLILPGRYYSEFREAEDRRRITAYWQSYGYFDVQVAPANTRIDEKNQTATIVWAITENTRYRIVEVHLKHAPAEQQPTLARMIPFAAGETQVDLETFRKVRVTMAEYLRRQGYGHAMVYSRTFVDRKKKGLYWYYYVDAGPKTRVGKVIVEGNVNIPDEVIVARAGMRPGDDYSSDTIRQREFDLLDTGAFSAAFIRTTADTVFLVPGDAPDTGGILRDEQVDAEGNLVPRKLSPTLDLTIHVREAPSQQVRLRAIAEIDPTRVDTGLGARIWLRNVFGPLHHLSIEGQLGYGWLFNSDSDDPAGVYGQGLVRYSRPGLMGRLGDFRLSARFRDQLYPGFHLREFTAGPGVRSTLAKGLFVDADVLFRLGQQVGFGPFDDNTVERFAIARDDTSMGAEAQLSLIWDQRDNPLEALKGHLLGLGLTFMPGGPLGTHRYLTLAPDMRGFLPLTKSISIGVRAAGGWVLLQGDNGVPLGPRLFGGGAYGMRGFGQQQMSPRVMLCTQQNNGEACAGQVVGGTSLLEGSLEVRWLPPLKPFGAVLWGDIGGAHETANPFGRGVNAALGLGLRLRFWYLPAALDVGYRLLGDSAWQAPADDPFTVFFRLGEAF